MLSKEGNKIIGLVLWVLIGLCSFTKAEATSEVHEIDVYGHVFRSKAKLELVKLSYPIEETQVKRSINNIPITQLRQEMDAFAAEFQMDDMAYVLFSQKVSRHFCADPNLAKLLQYQILKERGYKLLLGYNSEQLTVYGYFTYSLANVAEVSYQGQLFYDLSFQQNLALCEEELIEYSNGVQNIEINQHQAPLFNAQQTKYQFSTEYHEKRYEFKGVLNQSLIDYYHDLPSIAFGEIYLNYHLSDLAYKQLIGDLKKAVSNMSGQMQLNFLLHFTQVVIPYQTDKSLHGREKFAFAEEVLGKQAGDCEDKSVLFAYLVKEVLQLPSLALVYVHQNHLNVAVAVNGSQYNFIHNNQKYIVCEPSGPGLQAGENVYDWKNANLVAW